MKPRRHPLMSISNQFLFFLIIIVVFLKILIYILIKNNFISISLGGGSDANYYHSYVLGYINAAANIWPILLRKLHDVGLYSRQLISYFFFFLNIIVIPMLTCRLSGVSFKRQQKYYLYLLLLCLIYPTLYFYSSDIYRDVFMVFSFLVGCLTVKKMLNTNNFVIFSLLFILNIVIGLFLLGLRPYLGYAFILSLLLFNIKFTKKRLLILGMLYVIALFLAYSIGALDTLVEYRGGFDPDEGGSTLGLDFTNPVMFIPNLVLSTLGQLFGLYITNPLSVILLLVETIPFVGMLFYIIKNIKLADSFARFLIIFFVLYASVWLIGNDNLGTAVRLRLYNYFSVYICFFYILRLKQLITSNNMQVK